MSCLLGDRQQKVMDRNIDLSHVTVSLQARMTGFRVHSSQLLNEISLHLLKAYAANELLSHFYFI